MNYLAHLSLAQMNAASLTGNLMGDFLKGVDRESLPTPIMKGIQNHWAVDKFTDNYPAVLALKPLFNERYRRFAGVMIDVSFDYFLTKHWGRFQDVNQPDFVQQCYSLLLSYRAYMPARMVKTVEHMALGDWLSAYRTFDRIGFALDRIAQRIRFKNDFLGAGQEIEVHYNALEAVFLVFYPALQQHIKSLKIEPLMY